MTEPHIRLQGVGKRYKTKNGVVDACGDINLDIAQSEFVAIVGPSGCGKTTILKMVAGLTPYTAGTIEIGGKRVTEPQTDVGIVFQDSIMLDWRDVLANVMIQVDIDDLDDASWARPHDDDAVGEQHRLRNAVGDVKRRLACLHP